MSWRLRDGLLAQTALPEAIVLDTASGAYFELNAVASLVLVTLVGGGERDDAITRVTATFAIDATSAARDVDAFIADLHDRGWLVGGDA